MCVSTLINRDPLLDKNRTVVSGSGAGAGRSRRPSTICCPSCTARKKPGIPLPIGVISPITILVRVA